MIHFFSKFNRLIPFLIIGLLFPSCSTSRKTVSKRGTVEKIVLKDEKKNEIEKEISHNLKGDVRKVIEEAFTWLGTPYKFGGETKGKGADCSGYIMMVINNAIGCKMPRQSAKQAEFCDKIKEKNIKPGDLVFFATGNEKGKITHVGIMLDNKRFIHASSTKGVCVSTMDNAYYPSHLVMYGRVPCINQ